MRLKSPRASSLAVTGLLSVMLLNMACGSMEKDGNDAELLVVATTTILADLVHNVVGDAASVEILLPVGADPHEFQLSSQQAALVNRADLVVANGFSLEEGIIDVLQAAEADGANLLELAALVSPIPFGNHEEAGASGNCNPSIDHADGDSHESEGGEHAEEGSCDPHFWTDPLRLIQAADLLAAELAKLDDAIAWSENAERYSQQLESADAQVTALLQTIPEARRKLITNHDSLGYFADRYDFEVVATIIPGGSTLANPSSAELADLVALIRAEGVPVIFTETIEPDTLAEAIAAEIGEEVRVVTLHTDSLGDPGSEAGTLIDMLITNAEMIAGALS